LSKTNLYYQNPILVILQYRVYRFSFVDNEEDREEKEYIGITSNKISSSNTIGYKTIEDNIMFINQMGERRNE